MAGSEVYLLKERSRRLAVLGFVTLALLLAGGISITLGTLDFSPGIIWKALRAASEVDLANQVIFNVRLPRILTGLLVGMNLAVAGGLLQGVLRNSLASPQIIGVNAGAGLAAVAIMVLAPGQVSMIPPAAFIGALGAALLVYGLSQSPGAVSSTVHIVLAGVAVSAFLSSVTSGLMILHSDELDITYSWLLGGLSGRSWTYFHLIWPYTAGGILAALFLSPKLNLFALGDEVGKSLGLSIAFYRIALVVTAAVLAGSAVSVAGTVGFVGLIAPHMGRLLVGEDFRYLTPLSALLGALLLVSADTVARTIFQPVELPVGVITAALGAPFFLLLLYRRGK